MYPMQQQPVRRQFSGILSGVEPRQGGWMRFVIQEPGNQYPTKVDTSLPDLVNQAMSLLGQQVSGDYTESSDPNNINPRSGRPWINRRMESIGGGSFPQQPQPQGWGQQPQQPQQPQPQARGWNGPAQAPQQAQAQPQVVPGMMGMEKDLNICRQCASKVASMMLAGGVIPEEQRNMKGLIEVAEAWMAYYFYGPLRFGVTPFDVTTGQQAQEPQPQGWVSADPGPQEGQYETQE